MSGPAMDVAGALRRRGWLLAGAPVVTALLALGFVFLVTPTFRASTTLRLVEDESALGGAMAAAAASGGGGLSVLASLTGQGVPLQTEMAVLSSRGLLEGLVEELGLRVRVEEPGRVLRSAILAEAGLPLEGPEGTVTLERQADGRFQATAELLTGRDPFRVVGSERYEVRELGTVAPGEPLPLEGARLVLAAEAASHARIELRLLSREEAVEAVEKALSVLRPQRDADVVQVSFASNDPEIAARGANALVERYLTYREGIRVEKARRSADFLGLQLDSLAEERTAAEDSLRAFQEARNVLEPQAQISAEVERLADLKGRRDLLEAERAALSTLLGELGGAEASSRDLRRLAFFPSLLQSQGTAELLRLLGDLETQRTLLLERRTEGATAIRLMDERIAALEAELRRAAETYLQGLDHQVGALDEALAAFRSELDQVPAAALEYARLRRQVELLAELTVFLETRRKEAELNAAERGVGAYLLAAARPPLEPESPKPLLTLALALLVGVVLGAGGALALEGAGARSAGAAPAATD